MLSGIVFVLDTMVYIIYERGQIGFVTSKKTKYYEYYLDVFGDLSKCMSFL